MSDTGTSLAVLFHRVGPYHFARLRAAGRLLSIVAIESSGVDETYAWDVVAGADHFERITLFDRADAQKLPAAEVASRVASALDKVRPAVVAIPGWADSAALGALRWCIQNHVPAVAMSESTAWDKSRAWWKEGVKRKLVGLCSAALVGGTPHKDYMVKLGMPAERVFLGYDAVDNEYFSRKAEEVGSQPSEVEARIHGPKKAEMLKSETLKAESRNKYGLPEKYFLASARFVEKKNLLRLLQAYARYRQLAAVRDNGLRTTDYETAALRSKGLQDDKTTGQQDERPIVRVKPQSGNAASSSPVVSSPSQVVSGPVVPWSLVLLGDGPLKSDLCRLISDLGLDACVHLPGFKQYDELPVYYGLASAFVHASTTEPWGLVVNEAMASGLPVLVSNRCGCAQDLVQEGVNGFTFDPFNIEQLASLMLKISLRGVGPSGPEAAFQHFRLSAFGFASRGIIANWGPERFAQALQHAAAAALTAPPPSPRLLQKFLLQALVRR